MLTRVNCNVGSRCIFIDDETPTTRAGDAIVALEILHFAIVSDLFCDVSNFNAPIVVV